MGNPEMTPQQAWALIQKKHENLARREYECYLATGHIEPLDDESNPIYILIQAGDRPITYNRDRRTLFRGKNPQARLSVMENKIYILLLETPNVLQSYEKMYKTFYPDDVSHNSPRDLADMFRPYVSRLRDALEEVHPDLPKTIETVRGAGYVYLPHSSLQKESSLPPQG